MTTEEQLLQIRIQRCLGSIILHYLKTITVTENLTEEIIQDFYEDIQKLFKHISNKEDTIVPLNMIAGAIITLRLKSSGKYIEEIIKPLTLTYNTYSRIHKI
jgi:hypothetical protein